MGSDGTDEKDKRKTLRSKDRNARLKRICELLERQHVTQEVVRIVMAETGLSRRQIYMDVRLVYDQMSAVDDKERGTRKERMRRSWQAQFRRCVRLGKMAAANTALDRLTKLDGLYEPDKIEVTRGPDATVNWSAIPMDKRRELLDLYTALGVLGPGPGKPDDAAN